ncbi:MULTISPECIES: M61 family metallopeptidase [unclassified Mucilaginibacter]|uniref:M61 family metallopeptidase n=1 Tax=unclassified Mucilaginibacter TaxID=2617802 RepID=UPI000967887D|nr:MULTISPECIES: PDZ domain-containing protein [unclassified Mucilaginibacter]OJW17542.1 MAG: peptidase M61 [Mucilaginibacter sp. 44-25]PLW89806.1 MAG: peptidase M61 [Mucilaginibacter sp.]HEK21817.1 M61 family peptidase [Bacteroidota bacterium]
MKKFITLATAAFCAFSALAQSGKIKPIYYAVSFPNAVHHEAEITMTLPDAPGGKLKVRMSRSSPGRYATHEFGKNIYNVKATDATGAPLKIEQVEGDVYEIAEHPDVVKISYTLFGNHTDGTYVGIDASHAHLNMPASFMWVLGMDKRPLKFEFNDLDKYGWKVATQLKHEGDNVYSAPDLQYMMDSPTELANVKVSSWDVVNTNGKKQKMSIAVHSDDDQATIDNFAKMVQKLVLEEKAVFGEQPNYDFGSYTFLDDVYPANFGDGMEHRNSTCIVDRSAKVGGNENDLLGTFSHEFFHSWNVERIRPKSLEPFNFEHADMSNELWFAEGFTQYYGEMLLVRAGFNSVDDYTGTIAGLVNSVLANPAPSKFPPTQMSRYAVFVDAGVSVDATNYTNMFTSYYVYGGATALALDLRLRSEFKLTLDDYMRQVWLAYGKPEKPYTIPELQNVLAKLTNPKFAKAFFDDYIYGIKKNDYAELLSKAGLILQKAAPGKGWMGRVAARPANGGLQIVSATASNTPIYKAGLDADDLILKVDGKEAKELSALTDAVKDKKPGDKVTISYHNRTGDHEATVVLEESPALQVLTYEKANKELTQQQKDFRAAWLSSKVK